MTNREIASELRRLASLLDTEIVPEPREAITVCIDAGHGGTDPGEPGALPHLPTEAHLNLEIARALRELLVEQDLFVVMTRSADQYVSLEDRAETANRTGADLFLSIHCNSAELPADGYEVFVHDYAGAETTAFARRLLGMYEQAFPSRTNRGLKHANFHVLRETQMKAALFEVEFIAPSEGGHIWVTRRTAEIAMALRDGVLAQVKAMT